MSQSIDYIVSVGIARTFDNTSALTTALPGGIHRDAVKAPSDGSPVTQPYSIFTIQKARKKNIKMAGGGVIDRRLVIWKIYGPPTAADAAARALRDAYHCQPLTDGSGYTAVSVTEEQNDLLQLITDPRRNAEAVWQALWAMNVESAI